MLESPEDLKEPLRPAPHSKMLSHWDGAGPGRQEFSAKVENRCWSQFFFFFFKSLVPWGDETMIPFWPLKSSEIQWPGGAGHRYEQSVLWAFPVVSRAGSSCPGLTACAWPLEAPVLLAVGPEDWPRAPGL